MRFLPQFLLILGLVVGFCGPTAVAQTAPITGLQELVSLPVDDCDGLAVGDLDGDGAVDLFTSTGGNGTVSWFEQGARPTDWTRHEVHQGATEIEGNALADFDGDGQLEGISLDQKGHTILLHTFAEDPRESWETVPIQSDRPFLQESLVMDVDEDDRPELVYTWEGAASERGGVHWLDFEGDSVRTPDAWTDHTMISHESAWWLLPRPLDANGDGRARELIYTARNLANRNPGARPGVFWIAPSKDPTARWTRHAIDTTLSHPLHVDAGRFSPSDDPRDLIVGGFDTDQVHLYHWADSWTHQALDLPTIGGKTVRRIWNVKALPEGPDTPSALLVIASQNGRSALFLFQYRDGRYRSRVLQQLPYGHPMDDRLVLHDLTGDAAPELLVPDSGGGTLSIYQIERSK